MVEERESANLAIFDKEDKSRNSAAILKEERLGAVP
jgi:hypothetical protein